MNLIIKLRRYFVLLSVVLCVSTYADDFRGSSLGGACEDIVSNEISMGSTVLMSSNNVYVFKGSFIYKGQLIDEDIHIQYKCDEKHLLKSAYTVKSLKTSENVKEYYKKVYGVINGFHGEPEVYQLHEPLTENGMLDVLQWTLQDQTIRLSASYYVETEHSDASWSVITFFSK